MAPFLAVSLRDHANGRSFNNQVDNHHSLVTVTFFISGMCADEEATKTNCAVRFSSMIGHGSEWLEASKSLQSPGAQVVDCLSCGAVLDISLVLECFCEFRAISPLER